MTCAICHSTANPHCTAVVLGKYRVDYFQCSRCQFTFTEKPYWLEEAYDSAITRLDLGLVQRNEQLAGMTQAVIMRWFDRRARFIDYGGGYGMLVRMMRDRGFDFYRQDTYCPNLFAETFDVADVPPFRAELITAIEVVEHLPDPVSELEKMLELTDAILFSTLVLPTPHATPDSWWYFIPHTGQHVSLFSRTSLQVLAERLRLHYCWNKHNVHLFSRKPIPASVFRFITHLRINGLVNWLTGHPPTLLQADFNQMARFVPHQQKQ